MKVWNLARGTIRQFADAMSAEPSALSSDAMYD